MSAVTALKRVCLAPDGGIVNVSFLDGTSCCLKFSDGVVFEQAFRERVYAHWAFVGCEVDLVFAQDWTFPVSWS